MKKGKVLLIFVVLIAIATIGVYLVIGLQNEKKEAEKDEEVKQEEVVENPMLTDMEDVIYIQYKNQESTVTLVKTGIAWGSEDNKDLLLLTGVVEDKVAVLAKIQGTPVTDAVKADCGLETPAYELTVKDQETSVKLFIGVGADGSCYAMIEGKEEVYKIAKDVVDILNMKIDEFVDSEGDEYLSTEEVPEKETSDATEEQTSNDTSGDTADTSAETNNTPEE